MSIAQLAVIGVAIPLSTALPHVWPQYSLLLVRGGLFREICGPHAKVDELCSLREERLSDLCALFFACWSFGSPLAGSCMDFVGPRYTLLMGGTFNLGAVVSLALFNTTPAAAWASIATQGLATTFILFPIMSLADYHPDRAALVISFAHASLYFGSFLLPCILFVWNQNPSWTFRSIWITFAFVFIAPATLLMLFISPRKRPIFDRPASVRFPMVTPPSLRHIPSIHQPPSCTTLYAGSLPSIFNSEIGNGLRAATEFCADPPPTRFPSLFPLASSASVAPATTPTVRLSAVVSSTPFILTMCISSFIGFSQVYYQAALREISGIRISNFVGWLLTSQGLWCLIFGCIGDKYSSSTMFSLMNIGAAIVFSITLVPNIYVKYVAGFLFVIVNSYSYNPRYTACRIFSPPEWLGTLMGLSGISVGIGEMLSASVARLSHYVYILSSLIAGSFALEFLIRKLGKFEKQLLAPKADVSLLILDPVKSDV